MRERKEYTVIVNLGTEVINISAYDSSYAIKTARDTMIQEYGLELGLYAEYIVEEVKA